MRTLPALLVAERRRRVLVAALVCSMVACARGPATPPPPIVETYLAAIVAGRYDEAHAMTQLGQIAEQFGSGAAIGTVHFEAQWRAFPLEDFEVTDVVRIQRRDIEDFGEGTPYYEVTVRLNTPAGSRSEILFVDGDINPKLQVDPLPLTVSGADPSDRIVVDGVLLDDVKVAANAASLLVLGGRHAIEVGSASFTIDADPLAVVDGDARVADDERRLVEVVAT